MTLLVEHAVVGQQLLAAAGDHGAVADHQRRVVQRAVGVFGQAHDQRDAVHLGQQPFDAGGDRLRQCGAQQQVIRRIADQGQLGAGDQVGLQLVTRPSRSADDLVDVAVDIADPEIDLGQRELERLGHRSIIPESAV